MAEHTGWSARRSVARRRWPQSIYYLINVATVICEHERLTGCGQDDHAKAQDVVFRPPDDHAYEEALVELEIGGHVRNAGQPVLLEPLLPEDWRPKRGQQPMSPDYGVLVPKVSLPSRSLSGAEAYAAWHRMSGSNPHISFPPEC